MRGFEKRAGEEIDGEEKIKRARQKEGKKRVKQVSTNKATFPSPLRSHLFLSLLILFGCLDTKILFVFKRLLLNDFS